MLGEKKLKQGMSIKSPGLENADWSGKTLCEGSIWAEI